MDDQVEFDVNEALKLYLSDAATIPTPDANPALLDCENDPESLTVDLVNDVLDPVMDMLAENPEALMRSSAYDTIQFLLKCAPVSFLSASRYSQGTHAEPFRFLGSHRSSLLTP
jgi:condensin complex subunit 1